MFSSNWVSRHLNDRPCCCRAGAEASTGTLETALQARWRTDRLRLGFALELGPGAPEPAAQSGPARCAAVAVGRRQPALETRRSRSRSRPGSGPCALTAACSGWQPAVGTDPGSSGRGEFHQADYSDLQTAPPGCVRPGRCATTRPALGVIRCRLQARRRDGGLEAGGHWRSTARRALYPQTACDDAGAQSSSMSARATSPRKRPRQVVAGERRRQTGVN